MSSKLFTLFVAIVGLNYISVQIYAAPNGLNVIPTSDIYAGGQISLELQSDGSGKRIFSDDCQNFLNMQLGLGKGFDFGSDFCSDGHIYLNAKWNFLKEVKNIPAVVFGMQSLLITEGSASSETYLVFTKSFFNFRLHSGLINIDKEIKPLAGLDFPMNNLITIQIDFLEGISFAPVVNLQENIVFSPVVIFKSNNEIRHSINLQWLFNLKEDGK